MEISSSKYKKASFKCVYFWLICYNVGHCVIRTSILHGNKSNKYAMAMLLAILYVASGPRVKLASCKSALNPQVVYSTDRSKAVVPVLVLLFVALWVFLRGDLFYVLPCVMLFLYFSVLLALRFYSLRGIQRGMNENPCHTGRFV